MSAQECPQVDVLIPAFNAGSTLEESVGSIQRQTLRSIRILVVDDGSTDGTSEILRRLAREDLRIQVIERDNGGIVEALNQGLQACEAPFVARHDSDDVANPDRLERQLAYLTTTPSCVGVAANARHISDKGLPLGTFTQAQPVSLANPFAVPSVEPYLLHPLLMVRRSAIEAAGRYRHVFHAEDVDLYWRLLRQGDLHNMPEVLGDYRVHAESVTGASVLNGRIAAVSAQLASLSERRFRAGLQDIPFPASRLADYIKAHTLSAIVSAASKDLSPDESAYLAVASAAKMLEQSSFRPYELEATDVAFISDTLSRLRKFVPPGDLAAIRRRQIWTMARLLAAGDLRAAFAAPPSMYASVAFHLLRGRLRKLTRPFNPELGAAV